MGMILDTPMANPLAHLVSRYGAGAPRYTSYPTAVQFTADYGADEHAAALAALPLEAAVSLYVHIPFCERLCWFCGCHTRAVNRPDPVRRYVGLLRSEIALTASRLPARLSAQRLHLGGGTPNMTSVEDLHTLFSALRGAFDLLPAAEISAELDPVSLTREWVQAAADQGLNRASLGVQDLSPEVQAAVNRREGFDVLRRAVDWLREAGVRGLNFDLMYGLPRQTTRHVAETVDRVLTLRPDRLALFGYAHVPSVKPHQKLIRTDELPGPEARLEQSSVAGEILAAEGYVPIGMDHYALLHDGLAVAKAAGVLRRNFQGYTDDQARALLGFGASAISLLPQGIAQNHSQERLWQEAVSAQRLPVARGVAVSDEDRLRGAIIMQLMCNGAADIPAIRRELGGNEASLGDALDKLRGLALDGLVKVEHGRVDVTERGAPFIRAVCLAFDAYFDPGAGRHSTAV